MFLGKTAQSPSVFSHATRSTAEAHIYRSLAAGPSLETPSSSDRLAFHFLGKQYEHGWKWMNMCEHAWMCLSMYEHLGWCEPRWTKGSSKQLVISGHPGTQEVLLPLPCAPWEIVSSLAARCCHGGGLGGAGLSQWLSHPDLPNGWFLGCNWPTIKSARILFIMHLYDFICVSWISYHYISL